MNKRGQGDTSSLFLIFEIIIALAVAGIFIYSATNFESLSNVNLIFNEKDLDALSSTLISAPGEITYNYEMNSKYKVKSVQPFDLTKELSANGNYTLELSKEAHSNALSVQKS